MLTRCIIVGQSPATMSQRKHNIGTMPRVFRDVTRCQRECIFPAANAGRRRSVGFMLAQRLRRWSNINPTLGPNPRVFWIFSVLIRALVDCSVIHEIIHA